MVLARSTRIGESGIKPNKSTLRPIRTDGKVRGRLTGREGREAASSTDPVLTKEVFNEQ
jgi:hypothetical protein